MKNNITWIVLTDSNACRIYDYAKHPVKLTLVKEIFHPENKLKTSELVSDRPGHYKIKQHKSRGFFPINRS